jgi:hypothetical protein
MSGSIRTGWEAWRDDDKERSLWWWGVGAALFNIVLYTFVGWVAGKPVLSNALYGGVLWVFGLVLTVRSLASFYTKSERKPLTMLFGGMAIILMCVLGFLVASFQSLGLFQSPHGSPKTEAKVSIVVAVAALVYAMSSEVLRRVPAKR